MNAERFALNAALDHSKKQEEETAYYRTQAMQLADELAAAKEQLREAREALRPQARVSEFAAEAACVSPRSDADARTPLRRNSSVRHSE